jgi:hypothetical protein
VTKLRPENHEGPHSEECGPGVVAPTGVDPVTFRFQFAQGFLGTVYLGTIRRITRFLVVSVS